MKRSYCIGTIASLFLAGVAITGAFGSVPVPEPDSPEPALSDSVLPMGMIFIESPKRGRLVRLEGIVGKGELVARQNDGSCVSVAIRIASGNVNGQGVGISRAESIQLIIHSKAITESLLAGQEIFSSHHTVGYSDGVPVSDMQIANGLNITDEFVLNPGEWSWTSLFGLAKTEVTCERLFST
ncbi:hypothetical protein [Saccharospirillum alexandrii]|uniref:hypothetical protein n=1 Tax=Saccharospirillum alexandrii TaxID=2448477 RepID=UPI000FD9C01A|nr:hypothetical protein [Saccharospirillum alexandrii]